VACKPGVKARGTRSRFVRRLVLRAAGRLSGPPIGSVELTLISPANRRFGDEFVLTGLKFIGPPDRYRTGR